MIFTPDKGHGMDVGHEALAATTYVDSPYSLVVADSEEGLERLAGHAARAGCRVGARLPIEEAIERLDRQAAADVVLVELGAVDEAATAVLARIVAAAESGRYRSAISIDPAFIDSAATFLLSPAVEPLARPASADWAIAIGRAAARRAPRFRDAGNDEGGARLQELSEEVERIAGILASFPEARGAPAPALPAAREGKPLPPLDSAFVRNVIRARRLRERHFRKGLFADPAWDMMLDLLAARLAGRRVAVSSLCIAAAVPPTTALRWIKSLCDQGLFVRIADSDDGRRVFIELSDDTAVALEACLEAARRLSPTLL